MILTVIESTPPTIVYIETVDVAARLADLTGCRVRTETVFDPGDDHPLVRPFAKHDKPDERRAAVLNLIREKGPMRLADVIAASGYKKHAVEDTLNQLRNCGELEQECRGAGYRIAGSKPVPKEKPLERTPNPLELGAFFCCKLCDTDACRPILGAKQLRAHECVSHLADVHGIVVPQPQARLYFRRPEDAPGLPLPSPSSSA